MGESIFGFWMRSMWATYGAARGLAALSPAGGSASVAIGPGSPFHVAYGASVGGGATTWVGMDINHIVASEAAYMRAFAPAAFTGIPVVNAPGVLQTGQRAINCVTAAISGLARGWWPFSGQ